MDNEARETEGGRGQQNAGGDGGSERPDRQDKRRREYALRRAIADYGMGIIIFCIGLLLLIGPRLGINVATGIDDLFRYIFAGLCLLYGGFRVYRGSRKNYFN